MDHEHVLFETNPDAYEIVEIIGIGAFSKVYSCRLKGRKELLAAKVIDMEQPGVFEDTRKEINFLRASNHPNIVPFHCSFVHGKFLWLIMELMAGGSFLDIMRSSFPKGLEEPIICTVLKETLKAVEYLHTTGRMHRDLKAGNILLSGDGDVKLADFGLSAWMVENGIKRAQRSTFAGTPCWMAPEVMEQVGYDQRADIWSFGITALELAKGRAPYANKTPMQVLMLTIERPPPKLDREKNEKGEHRFSKTFKEMIASCLHKDPSKRPTATKLLDHKFFKGAKKPEFLVANVINKIPSLQERAKKVLKQKETGDAAQPTKKVGEKDEDDHWNFSDSDDEDDEKNKDLIKKSTTTTLPPMSATPKPSAAPLSPGTSKEEIKSTVQKGRFVVQQSGGQSEPSLTVSSGTVTQGKSGTLTTSSSNLTAASHSPVPTTAQPHSQAPHSPPEKVVEKKGRFTVSNN